MKKAVFVSTCNIFDEQGNGGARASREHYDMLANHMGQQNVKTLLFVSLGEYSCLCDEIRYNTRVFERLQSKMQLLFAALFGCRLYMPWQEKRILHEIDSFEPDVVFFDFSVEGRLLRKKNKYRTICFFHNVESDYTWNKMKTDGIWYLPAFFAAKANDRWALRADLIMCFNHRDSDRLLELHGRGADSILPISIKDRFVEKRCVPGDKRRLLFLGSCFGPNEDGIEWFMEKVMPNLEGITLDIVGLGFEEKRKQYALYPNVNVIGAVEDTDEYYYTHPIVIMPIRYGSGMKVKTAEAMMFGRIIIASDEALEGYDVEGVKGIVRCNRSEDYIRTIKELLEGNDCGGWDAKFMNEVRELYLEKYESMSVQRVFNEIITDGLKNSSA